MVWITKSAMFLTCSTQMGPSMVSVMMTSMNPSIEYSFDSTSTASVSPGTTGVESGRFPSLGSKCLCGYWSYDASHDVSMQRSFTRSNPVSIIVVYSYVDGVVSNLIRRKIKSSTSTINLHVDTIFEFAWIC